MTAKGLQIIRAVSLVVMLVAIASTLGCASVQTPATQQIDTILTDGTLDKYDTTEKKKIESALKTAKKEILQTTKDADERVAKADEARQAADKKAEKAETWAHRGKIGAWVLCGIALLLIVGTALRVLEARSI